MQHLHKAVSRPIARFALILAMLTIAAGGLPADDKPAKLDQKIDRLIEQLGNADYHVRQQAHDELAKLGFEAFDALTVAQTHEDLEIAARAKYLLRLMRVQWTIESDPPEVKKCLEKYEFRDTGGRLLQMRKLAALPDGMGTPALCRLVRFELSAVLSKYAAIQILGQQPPDAPPEAELAAALKKNLGHSRQPGAQWLFACLKFRDDPEKALAAWSKLVEEEQATLHRSAEQSRGEIVAALIRYQINWLSKLGRKDESLTAMRKLIDLERGDPESLAELVKWLVEEKAWGLVSEVATRFASRFARDPKLLYTLAQAYKVQGKDVLAEETARQALGLHPGPRAEQLVAHLMTAYNLRQQGLFQWAEQEYRHVIATGAAGHNYTVTAHYGLSEMFHDQGKDLPAAQVLDEAVQNFEKNKIVKKEYAGRTLNEVRSRMDFFFACHWGEKGNRARQREHLDKALETEPGDIDVLIACYRLPDPTPEYRKKILDLINKAAAAQRAQIAGNPDESTSYNQFAWLIANTEGDFDQALAYSKKSIELKPDYGGYYDTLAHCYFAKGDYAGAVKNQVKAAEMDPHSGQILRQLEFFRKTLKEKGM